MSTTKYIVWIKQDGRWIEQGDGPLTAKQALRIAREIRADFGIPVITSHEEVIPACVSTNTVQEVTP